MNETERKNILQKVIADLEMLSESEWNIDTREKLKKAIEILYGVNIWDIL